MNRIYQGKVTGVEISIGKDEWEKLDDWASSLWRHHALFQDAVNYYLMALFALADENNENVLSIGQRLNETGEEGKPGAYHVWTQVRRRGTIRKGMRESIARTLAIGKSDVSPENCFKDLLYDNKSSPAQLDLALAELLHECKGDSAIQQKGREMLPRFCDPAFSGAFPYSKMAVAKAASKEGLPNLLHSPETAERIDKLPNKLEFSYFANVNDKVSPFTADKAKCKLKEALEFVSEQSAAVKKIKAALLDKIQRLPASVSFPAYRGGSVNREALKRRFYAYLLFVHVEQTDATFTALRDAFPEPRKKKAKSKESTVDFLKFDDDPILLSRGDRGFVFRAFTSLSGWSDKGDGKPMWKEFDIAAFKEALKALHQVQLKSVERRKERDKLAYRLACMNGEKEWRAQGEEEEAAPPLIQGDPRVERLSAILDSDLAQEYELTEGQSTAYGLRPRTIRGFRELRDKWEKIAPRGAQPTDEVRQRLAEQLRLYQRDNAYSVGSVRLYEELLKPVNWVVWQKAELSEQLDWRQAAELGDVLDFADDPVSALTDARQLERKIESLKEPVRFTPADPAYSRRQFYFSDVCDFKARGNYRHESNAQAVIVPLAVSKDSKYEKKRVRLRYSAPRLLRDELRTNHGADLKSATFLQPMMEALGVANEMTQDISNHAVSLMPELLSTGEMRMLLNFPIELDTAALIKRLGKQARWEKQFASYGDKNFYLRWPSLTKGITAKPEQWWWEKLDAFTCMAVDLGQRDAGAFAVLDVRANHDFGKKPAREIGTTNDKAWISAVAEVGLLRLPGEDAKVFRNGTLQTEFYGERGRSADSWEWKEALDIARALCPDLEPEEFAGRNAGELSFPQQNDGLLRCLRLAQSRLARLQSLSWQLLDKKRADGALSAMNENEYLPELVPSTRAPADARITAQAVTAQADKLRITLQAELVHVADRILPLRNRQWEWGKLADETGCHVLRQTAQGTTKNARKVMGQRGISMERIGQLESLRRRAQSLNRALMQKPGVKPVLGRATRGVELPDPCPEILDRLDRIKEQRINQTAHLILARALGLRLRSPAKGRTERVAKNIHGEYELSRPPVDFIVMEDLSRYLSSQGRAPSENSRLMQWCHRALLGKLKQLCEPYGISVIEATAAYSSRFCSRSGVAGFRGEELHPGSKTKWKWQRQLDQLASHENGESRVDAARLKRLQHLTALFDVLGQINKSRAGRQPRTLLAPVAGGPVFIPARGSAMQADINAAINIGMRAIAAPDCHAVHLRIRSQVRDGQFHVRTDSKREKASWGESGPIIEVQNDGDADTLLTSRKPNFFVDHARLANYDRASIEALSLPLASGRGIWGTLRQAEWRIANRLNNDRLEKWGYGRLLDDGEGRSD